jgi:hypothetical protein
MKVLSGTPSHGTTPHTMIWQDRLVCRAYWGQPCLNGRSLKFTARNPHVGDTKVQHENHRNALNGKVLQKAEMLAMRKLKRATGAQSCVRTELSAVNGHSLRFKYRATAAALLPS